MFLDPKERNNTEYKLDVFSGVYKKLCGKDVVFEYPISEAWSNIYHESYVREFFFYQFCDNLKNNGLKVFFINV